MGIFLPTDAATSIYIGTEKIDAIYVGSTKIWSATVKPGIPTANSPSGGGPMSSPPAGSTLDVTFDANGGSDATAICIAAQTSGFALVDGTGTPYASWDPATNTWASGFNWIPLSPTVADTESITYANTSESINWNLSPGGSVDWAAAVKNADGEISDFSPPQSFRYSTH